jgi:hypothetical protein
MIPPLDRSFNTSSPFPLFLSFFLPHLSTLTSLCFIVDTTGDSVMETDKSKLESLRPLLDSEFFDLWMCVTYLKKYEDHDDVTEYLCQNVLPKHNLSDFEFFLPQIQNLAIQSPCKRHLVPFLLTRCGAWMHFALRLYWLLSSAPAPSFREEVDKLQDQIEISAINGRDDMPRNVLFIDDFHSKHARCSFFNRELQFVNSLVEISERLRHVPIPQRESTMRVLLLQLNGFIADGSELYIPLCHSEQKFRRVLQLVPSEAILLKSREKCPYMLISEVIRGKTPVLCDSERQGSDDSWHKKREKTVEIEGPSPRRTKSLEFDRRSEPKDETIRSPTLPGGGRRATALEEEIQKCEEEGTEGGDGLSPSHRKIRSSAVVDEIELIPSGSSSSLTESEDKEEKVTSATPKSIHSAIDMRDRDISDIIPMMDASTLDVSSPTSPISPLLCDGEVVEEDDESREWSVVRRDAGPFGFGKTWKDKRKGLRKLSPFGKHRSWNLVNVIVKSGDDILQEELAMQMIAQFSAIFMAEGLPLRLRPYRVMAISEQSGLVETITDSISIDALKRSFGGSVSLYEYFCMTYGEHTLNMRRAQRNFVESMAAYSVVCHLLQVKDRHNGNILLDKNGHVIHIDFGFMLSSSPGSINFEGEILKLSQEYIEVMDGLHSDMFSYFCALVIRGFLVARKHMDRIASLVELMLPNHQLPCFSKDGGYQTLDELRERFKLSMPESDFVELVNDLIEQSVDNWRTRHYDTFQRLTNGIL